jgi:hypothetical protein
MNVLTLCRAMVLSAAAGLPMACATAAPAQCQAPAQVIGASETIKSGWVLVRPEASVVETAQRVARELNVSTEPMRYSHAFNISPLSANVVSKLQCDKAILEIHYSIPTKTAS